MTQAELDSLRTELEKQLQAKTGWGRNEILAAFDKAVIAHLLKERNDA